MNITNDLEIKLKQIAIVNTEDVSMANTSGIGVYLDSFHIIYLYKIIWGIILKNDTNLSTKHNRQDFISSFFSQ